MEEFDTPGTETKINDLKEARGRGRAFENIQSGPAALAANVNSFRARSVCSEDIERFRKVRNRPGASFRKQG